MAHLPRIQFVDHRALLTAQQLHAVQMVAYAQEAKLLGAIYFSPLERTVDEVRATDEVFLGAFMSQELVGAASVWPDPEGMGMNIASLAVVPHFQRQGIGTALMASVVATNGSGEITVQTGAKNLPALSIYARAGFIELRRWFVGREPLELVKLQQLPSVSSYGEKGAA
jgi:ribosomal protein S18 acetylase RimI-like enzyme